MKKKLVLILLSLGSTILDISQMCEPALTGYESNIVASQVREATAFLERKLDNERRHKAIMAVKCWSYGVMVFGGLNLNLPCEKQHGSHLEPHHRGIARV